MPAFNKLKSMLSTKWASLAIIAAALLARLIQIVFFYNLNVDGMYQVQAMQNFVEGHGISTSYVLPGDLSTVIYEPLIKWPPGYSVLLSPFYLLLGQNFILAGILLEILMATVLLFTCRAILKELGVATYLVNVFTIIHGLFIYFFYFICSSDASAISFFAVGIYLMIRIIKQKRFSWKFTLLLCLSLIATGMIKYLFIPIVFAIPFFLLIYSVQHRSSAIKKTAFIASLVLIASLGGLLLWQKLSTGSAVYLSEPTRGFFTGNLRNYYPALPASFVDPYSLSVVLPTGHTLVRILYRLMQFIHITALLFIFIVVIRKFIKNQFVNIGVADSFLVLSLLICMGINLELGILSLRVGKEENIPGHLWSYIEEPRYYGIVNILVHLNVILWYSISKQRNNLRLKYLLVALLVLLIPETLRGLYFVSKRVVNAGKEEYSWQFEKNIQEFGRKVLARELKEDEKAVVTGSIYYFNYRVAMYNHLPVLLDVSKLNKPGSISSHTPSLLLVLLHERDINLYDAFLRRPEISFAGQMNGFYFYTLHVGTK